MTVVTISAAYGAGGSVIGPMVAEELGVPFLDRAIPVAVAERLDVSEREACERDETVGSWMSRALLAFGQMGPVLGGAEPVQVAGADEFCSATEQVLRERASTGAVVLGRAGALVLAEHPTALHVRLTGPLDARIEQAITLGEEDRRTAERLAEQADRAREAYVRHFYRADARDPAHYHLVVDSTALPLPACAALLVAAAQARQQARG
jgi:cytidylate kinase